MLFSEDLGTKLIVIEGKHAETLGTIKSMEHRMM